MVPLLSSLDHPLVLIRGQRLRARQPIPEYLRQAVLLGRQQRALEPISKAMPLMATQRLSQEIR